MAKKTLLLYCVPLAFLTLYIDEVWGYALLIAGAFACGWLAQKTDGALFWWGNLLSAAVSAACAWAVFGKEMDDYFKPFGALGWLAALSVVSLGIQWLVKKKEWLVLGLASGAVSLMLLVMYSLQWSL